MNKLSLAMIVRDEEKNLLRLLPSVQGCFDQIVIVDTGSVDQTRNVALQHGAEVHDFKWIDDFSAARNFSFSKVTSPWVMWLDADDILLPENRDKLLSLKSSLGGADAYLMPYDYFQDATGKSVCTLHLHRILRMAKGPRWELPIHEHPGVHAGWRQQKTDIVITHKRSPEDQARDAGRNVRILRSALEKDPENPRLLFYYGKELQEEGKHLEAIPALEKFLAKGGWHEDVINGWYLLACSLMGRGDAEAAIDSALKGIRLDPRWAEFYCLIGQVYYDRADWRSAIRWFELALTRTVPETLGTVRLENYTWIPRDRLCKAYSELGDFQKAYQFNEEALVFNPADGRLKFNREFLRDRLFDRSSHRPVRLNLGSGGKPASGFRSCDLYAGEKIEFQIDQSKLPFRDGTIHAIRSEHALEHSESHYSAEKTISEWARASRYGATLHLMVPDLDMCCRYFVEQPDRRRSEMEKWTSKEWYKYTIYGIQVGQNHEPDQGQYHRTGFTEGQLLRLLSSNGYEIRQFNSYDGFGTPSLEFHAIQTGKKPKAAWMLRGMDPNDPSTRIRRLNPHIWLSQHGIDSRMFPSYQGKDAGAIFAMTRDYDVVIFSFFSDLERQVMDKLRLAGVTVIADYNEDIEEHPQVAACLQSASVIVCCSTALAEKASKFGRTVTIPDAYESVPVSPTKEIKS